jgi:hypothetical protein
LLNIIGCIEVPDGGAVWGDKNCELWIVN